MGIVSLSDFFNGTQLRELEAALPRFLTAQRWFRSKARVLCRATVIDRIFAPCDPQVVIGVVQVEYADGERPERYLLPLALGEAAEAHVILRTARGVLHVAHAEPAFDLALHDAMHHGARWTGTTGEVTGAASPLFAAETKPAFATRLLGAEQSNTSIVFDDRWILKLYGLLDDGPSPDLEIGRFLSEHVSFAHVPKTGGWLIYRSGDGQEATLGLMQEFYAGGRDAWTQALEAVHESYARASAAEAKVSKEIPTRQGLDPSSVLPTDTEAVLGSYRDVLALLGRRVAQLHLALASTKENPAFAPEPVTEAHRHATSTRMQELTTRNLALLGKLRLSLPEKLRPTARRVVGTQGRIIAHFQSLAERPVMAQRMRIHGDLHLGQILAVRGDFIFLDFEGEPARSIAERRAKDLPLRDVAGMLRSFHYAAFAPLLAESGKDIVRQTPLTTAVAWQQAAETVFLRAYLEEAHGATFLPRENDDLQLWLKAFVLEKAIYELGYELNNRPSWLAIPLDAIERALPRSA
jgi:trehalose synthase-fused probable maltokinase